MLTNDGRHVAPEGLRGGKYDGKYNAEYDMARSAIAQEAEKTTNAAMLPAPKAVGAEKEIWNAKWNKMFHGLMDISCKKAGLIK
jgi:hypothetical protein